MTIGLPFDRLTQMSDRPEDNFAITFAPLSLDHAYGLADDGANGAIALFSGMVRNQTDGLSVAAEIRKIWPDITHVVIHPRTGKLTVGEISVLVAIGSPHRSEAFAACQYAIDTLKHNAPIWKKEHWKDGSTSWVSISACEDVSNSHPNPAHLKT